jgi:hypothetical protein
VLHISFRDLFFFSTTPFSMEYRELCVATESLPHENNIDLTSDIISPVISSEDFDFLSGLCLN